MRPLGSCWPRASIQDRVSAADEACIVRLGSTPRLHASSGLRRYASIIVLAVACASAMLVPQALSIPQFGYHGPELRTTLEIAAALISLLALYLIGQRCRLHRSLSNLALVCSLALIALSNLGFLAIPVALTTREPGVISTWAAVLGQLLGASGLALAAFAPGIRLPRRSFLIIAAPGACLIFLLTVAGIFAATSLPRGIVAMAVNGPGEVRLVELPLQFATEAITVAALAIAAMGFARRSTRDGDALLRWFAYAAVTAAFARLNYIFVPSQYSNQLYEGDVLRALSFCFILLGSVREIDRYWRGMASVARHEERRRIARELHDGLAQELAFISRATMRRDFRDAAAELAAAADRALTEVRCTIEALMRSHEEAFPEGLEAAVNRIAGRYGAKVDIDIRGGRNLRDHEKDELVRITSEAVANAAWHGKARNIAVRLSADKWIRLEIQDDGVGFDFLAVPPDGGGFGLSSMAERARMLGGTFRVESGRGIGTTIEVVVP